MPRNTPPTGRPKGRPPGAKNKRTIERETRAAQLAAVTMERALERRAHPNELVLGVDVLMKFTQIFEGAAAHFQPTLIRGSDGRTFEQPGAGDWGKFGEWADRAVTAARELAKYQSPQLRAVMVAAPPPPVDQSEDRKRITLKVFDGGKVVQPMLKGRVA